MTVNPLIGTYRTATSSLGCIVITAYSDVDVVASTIESATLADIIVIGSGGDTTYFTSVPIGTGEGDVQINYTADAKGVVTTTSDLTMTGLYDIVLADASASQITITLPPADDFNGVLISVKKVDSTGNAVVVSTQNGDTVDGASSLSIYDQYVTLGVVSNGLDWYIV